MEMVPASLVRISRYYMVAAIGYLLLTLFIGVTRVLSSLPDPLFHWAPAVLGWVTFPIMGAFYQFFPTLQGRDLRWEQLTLPQFALMNVGVIGLMAAAWTGNSTALSIFAVIYAAGALLFAAIIALANTDLTKTNLTLRFYLASLTYFVVGVMLFLAKALAIGPGWVTQSFLLHVLAFGWAVVAIMGAEYAMVPMLQLKVLRYPRLADAQFYVVNAGFVGLAISMITGNTALMAAAGTVTLIGILIFAHIMIASLRHGPSRLPHMDISVRYFLAGIAYLVATATVGSVMTTFGWYSLIPIYVHLGLIGTITLTIVGAMYHIVPFVVWWEVYAPKLGYEDVPLLKQLFNERAALLQFYGLNAGLLLMIAGFASRMNLLVALGGTVLILTAMSFAWEMLKVVGHRRDLNKPVNGHTTTENLYGGTP